MNVTGCNTFRPHIWVQTSYSKVMVCLSYSQAGSSVLSGQQSKDKLGKPDPW